MVWCKDGIGNFVWWVEVCLRILCVSFEDACKLEKSSITIKYISFNT